MKRGENEGRPVIEIFIIHRLNLTSPCNAACNCEQTKYAPVCHELSGTTFFSACHAGCRAIINDTTFDDCTCIDSLFQDTSLHLDNQTLELGFHALKNRLVTAGPCKQDCSIPFILFTTLSIVTNVFCSSARIGYILVSYRCVETKDKSLALGVAALVTSMFGFVPGPILFGAIMDSTCLVWNISCEEKGNCWFYDRDNFRYYVNLASACSYMLIIINAKKF